jgi:hypothetical protein
MTGSSSSLESEVQQINACIYGYKRLGAPQGCPQQTKQAYKPGSVVRPLAVGLVTIYLALELPLGSSDQPEDIGRASL